MPIDILLAICYNIYRKGKADNPQTAERLIKMKKLNLYRVDFDIKKFGEHHYFYYCYAHNAKEARSFAESLVFL